MFKVAVGEVEVPDVEFEDVCDGKVNLLGTIPSPSAGLFLTTPCPPTPPAAPKRKQANEQQLWFAKSIVFYFQF